MRRDSATLLDIVGAGRLVGEFLRDSSRAAFAGDHKTVSAVTYQIAVIGEAVKRLSPRFRESHPDVPWQDIAGMRDKLIHDYGDVDAEEVWRTATRDVPELLARLEPLLPTGGAE